MIRFTRFTFVSTLAIASLAITAGARADDLQNLKTQASDTAHKAAGDTQDAADTGAKKANEAANSVSKTAKKAAHDAKSSTKTPVDKAEKTAKAGLAKKKTLPDGLVIEDTVVGKGKEAKSGNDVTVEYTGKLKDSGKQFDTSVGREPFKFKLGAGQVIKGWDEGVAGMKEGGKRTLTIPAALGYGDRGAGGVIPPGADLVFNVEMKKVD